MDYLNRYDSVWLEKYRLAKQYYEQNGHLLIPQIYPVNGVNLGIWLCNQRTSYRKGTLSEERIKLLEDIGIRWNIKQETVNENLEHNGFSYEIDKTLTQNRWNLNFKLASSYYKEFGHLLIPYNYVINGIRLGTWICNQRNLYRINELSEERIKLLESIGMVWSKQKMTVNNDFIENGLTYQDNISVNENNWNLKYQLATTYYEKHGNLLVPHKYIVNGINLGDWIGQQRKTYKSGKISKERIKLLESIGMVWQLYQKVVNLKPTNKKLTRDDIWFKKYQLASTYYKENGHLLIPLTYEINNVKLGLWVRNQREKYLNNCQNLSEEQISLLEQIGMIWHIHDTRTNISKTNPSPANRREVKWFEKYQLAVSYYKEHGHLIIPRHYIVNDIKLGNWLNSQRTLYKEGKLSQDQITLLERIGMIWSINNNQKDIKTVCISYGINPNLVTNIPYKVLVSTINYLIFNNLPVTENGKLHPMFLMSSFNLKENYNLTYEELVNNYYEIKEEKSLKKRTLEK